jgi:hypothetical protein
MYFVGLTLKANPRRGKEKRDLKCLHKTAYMGLFSKDITEK